LRYWVLKGNPQANDWDAMLVPGTAGKWHTGRAPKDWASGDRLFCWESTPALRVIGLATLVQTNCGLDEEGDLLFQVEYQTSRIASMPQIAELRRIPILNAASFLKAGPATTVFPLSSDQAEILFRLLVARNPELSQVWNDLHVSPIPTLYPDTDISDGGVEGARKWVSHFARERNRTIVETKKRDVLKRTGTLACEVCTFDFAQFYGVVGERFCEVHHRIPLAEADKPVETKLEDLAVVCSNCHRMLHRASPFVSVEQLRDQLGKRRDLTVRSTGRSPATRARAG
jgi:hypothetical protein